MSLKKHLFNAAYHLDQAVASLIWGSSQATISSAAAKASQAGTWWGRWLCYGLNWMDPGHCEAAIAHADSLDHADDHVEK